MKTCSKCGRPKHPTAFRRDRTKPDGLHSVCKDCRRAADAEQKLRRRYGLSRASWQRMYDHQGGRCRICRSRPKGKLEVDHCHRTGKVRGLLCGACNKAIGLLRDEPETISRAAVYVARHQGE